jgi:hypothetical protein
MSETGAILTPEDVARAKASDGPVWGTAIQGSWRITVGRLCDSHEALRRALDEANATIEVLSDTDAVRALTQAQHDIATGKMVASPVAESGSDATTQVFRSAAAFQQGRAMEFERALAEAQARELAIRQVARDYIIAWNNLDVPGEEGDELLVKLNRMVGAPTDSTALRELCERVAREARTADDGIRPAENELGEMYVKCDECGASDWGEDSQDIEHYAGCAFVAGIVARVLGEGGTQG